jgi:hypothetical protein
MRLTRFATCAALTLVYGAAYAVPAVMARGGLTPEERFLYMREQRGLNWRDLSQAQRCERMFELRRARGAMTAADATKLKQRMDVEWKALPAAEQRRVEQQIAARHARRAENPRRQGLPRCAGGAMEGGAPH